MQGKTKQGATSLIVTMFFTLLAGILVLSFVSVMLSNINESTNYNLSQSAYDSALAGIEDAKVMLLEYNNCLARGDTTSTRCKTVVDTIRADGSDDDCDVVRNALGRASGENETLIRTDNSNTTGGVDSTFDMAYTCVKVSMKTPNYLGTITRDSDMKVIPLRSHSAAESNATSTVNRIRLEWFSNEDANTIISNNLSGTYEPAIGYNASTTFSTNKVTAENIRSGMNQFNTASSLPPAITIGLIQAGTPTISGGGWYGGSSTKGFALADFIMEDNNHNTNRGRITLRPVFDSSIDYSRETIPRQVIHNNGSEGFGVSTRAASTQYSSDTNNADNSPIDVKCYNLDNIGTHTYACSVDIDLPKAYGGNEVMDILRYVTLSTPYSKPDISFSLSMLECGETDCSSVDFVGVQSSVDSTGRANDLFRRIDARVELVDVGYPFPKYALGVYGDGGEGDIIKNYRVTQECWNINIGTNYGCDGTSTNFSSEGYNGGF